MPPVEFDDAAKAGAADEGSVGERSDDERIVGAGEGAEGGEIAVVVMVVAEEDDVDRRELGKGKAWRLNAAGAEAVERTADLAEVRIGEKRGARGLDEKSRVTDGGENAVVVARRRRRRVRCERDVGGPRSRAAGAAPAKNVEPGAVFVARVEESFPVEVVGRRE